MKTLTCHSLLFGASAAVLLVTGCGGSGENLCVVTGKITLDDTSLAGATVMFTTTGDGKGSNASGFTREDGTYTIQTPSGKADGGTTEGTYIVTISKKEEKWDGKSYIVDEFTNEKSQMMHASETLPKLYTSQGSSPFTVTVEPKKKNVFDFALKSRP